MNESARYRELITFCNILSISLRSGKPLPETMTALSGNAAESKSSLWCRNLARKLADGYSPEDACRELAGFDGVLARLMPLLGEKKLIKVLEIYTSFLVNLAIVKEQLTAVLFYPLFVVGLMILNLLHLNIFLFPRIYEQVLATGKSLPMMMRILYFVQVDCWPLSLIIPGLMILAFIEMLRASLSAKISSESMITRLFGVASAIRIQEISRLQGIIALYLQSGFSIEKALTTTADFAEGSDKESLNNVAATIAHGTEPAFAFSHSSILSDLYLTSADAQMLAEKLGYVSESNSRHANADLKKFSNKMFIVTLLLTGFFVAIVTSSFFDSYYWVIWSFL